MTLKHDFKSIQGLSHKEDIYSYAANNVVIRVWRVIRTVPHQHASVELLNGSINGYEARLMVFWQDQPIGFKWKLQTPTKIINGISDQFGCAVDFDLPWPHDDDDAISVILEIELDDLQLSLGDFAIVG